MNGVYYSTIEHEKNMLTQNSGVMTYGTYGDDGEKYEYYGVLKEVIELQYGSTKEFRRSVVIF